MADQDPGGISPLQQMVASGAGAVVTSLFMTPLDVVKVRLQSQRPSVASEPVTSSRLWSLSYTKWKCLLYCNGVLEPLYLCPNGARCATWFQDPTRFTGTVDAFVKIIRHEGTRTLWSGLPATLVMTVPATAVYFTAYDQLKAFLCGRALTSDLYAPMVAGALARLGTVTVVSPLELVRTKLQAQRLSYRELGTCVRAAVAQGGWRSLWLGWGPTALRDVPFSALYWFSYELVKSWLSGLRPKDQTSVGISFVAGGISGMVAATLTLPFDVVKTQRQVALGAVEAVRATPAHADSTWLLLQRIRAESGTRGLFAGFLPRIIKAAPSCAIMISTYEFGKNFFQRLHEEQLLGP
ncbi:probable mitochondrial glutathione transporter SLC25A39 isoform X4 [Hippopotamus amphibius kiboko]|uniref:probable mitochondrial glutathione transporter SLC25A39 isoform X4 n=1 Tax=Hippopotamus amphibius kiboko TaxID=575201 RepID=UPI002594F4C3|nr:probable mitochondrial glutathione transporter SLC25A39 isoform X4 [Hippopotamus amphibius kiboko]XP_057572755.1 probable mitochondrial glutathione transporter SLC25A39 isoform X4 [Hippopotamus amphibius kiboko]